MFSAVLAEEGVTPYPGSVACWMSLTASGTAVAVVSSSRNAPAVLTAAGLADRFEVVVDGAVAAAESLAGKPSPDTFLNAAQRSGPPGPCRRGRGRPVGGRGRAARGTSDW